MDFQERNDDDARLAQAQDAMGNPGAGEALIPADQNVVTLPAGRTIQDLVVEGRNLVIVMDDGSRIVVPDGAVFVPQIVVGGVAVPPFNVAQLLTGNEPEPAAGPLGSSGGNFAADEGEIQAAFDLGDLLPFTDFGFPQFPDEEIIPAVADREPDVVIETPDNPAGAIDAIATVSEDGLPARNSPLEPEGTDAPAASETASGTIVFSTPDGLSQILINGVAITSTGQTFTSPFGTLTITSINLATGEVGFSYSLEDNTLGEDRDGFFAVTVIDTDGDVATASLSIIIEDDSPIAADDIGIVPAGSHAAITGNVLDNDVSGADDYPAEGGVTQFAKGGTTVAAGSSLQGEYGVLTLNADGSYSYVRDYATPGGVEESFTYTIVDQDGSVSTATLVIEIGDSPNIITSVPQTGDGTVVDERGLPGRGDEPAGTGEIADANPDNNSDQTETTGSVITFNSPDGLSQVTINGVPVDPDNLPQTIIQTGSGTMVITGFTYDPVTGDGSIEYEFTLGDNTAGDDTNVDFVIAVTDLDGDTASETLTITIVDDQPLAVNDTAAQDAENAPVTVDVFANDTPGADDVLFGDIALVENSLTGSGTVRYNGDGTFTYTPGPGEQGTVEFRYSITDGDGDVSSATVTIVLLRDSEPEISVEGDNDVAEAGLAARDGEPAGSDEASSSEIATGVIGIATGNDTVASLVIAGIDVTGGGSVTTAKGVLVISLENGQYSYSYTLTDNTLTDPDSDSFTLTVTDSDGDTASTTLVIAIIDDNPSAVDDANAIGAGEFGPVGGSVLNNDTQGADGAQVTSYTGTGGSGAVGEVVQGSYGVLTIAADGSYSYTRDPGTPGGVSDSFQYTITDGDGDTATATLVISIADAGTSLDLPAAGEAGTEVLEEGLAGPPAGSDAASDGEFTSGVFTFTAPDGPATITIDGLPVTAVGQTFTGTYGTLTIEAIAAGSVTYSYELTTATNGDSTMDSFAVRVTDQDGDFSEGPLEIAIVDDVPTANADMDSVQEDGPLVADGNLLAGLGGADANATDGVADVGGADGAAVTGVAAGTTVGPVAGSLDVGVAGTYGVLTVNADGSYSYQLDNGNPLVQGLDQTESLTDSFTYTITDGDGDVSTTTLTIRINGADDPVVINGLDGEGAEQTLLENDLADGTSPDAAALTRTGSFTIDSPDGLATLTVGGASVFAAGTAVTFPVTVDDPVYGLLQITAVTETTDANGDVVSATVFYSYVLQDNSLLHTGSDDGSFTDSFSVVAIDSDGTTTTASLDITIVDDSPVATDNAAMVTEGAEVSGNVLTDDDGFGTDAAGADGFGAAGAVIRIDSVNQTTTTDVADGSGNLVLVGQYGTLTVNVLTGTYSYAADANSTNVDAQDVFTYTIVDGDGDPSTATLTIDIDNVAGIVSDNGVLVYEAGLPLVGSDAAASSEIDADGQITVTGASGTLSFVLLSPADGTYGTLVLDPDTGTYTYTLDQPFTDVVDENGNNTVTGAESFAYEVRDEFGNLVGSGSIRVDIVDDVPTATDQANINVAEDAVGTIGGNVLADGTPDTEGADGASVTAITIDGNTTAVPQDGNAATVITAKGTYTIDMDGNWTFDPNPNLDHSGGDIAADFTYTLTDGDGDFDTAVQPITITDGAGPAAGLPISLALDDQNLADGSTPGTTSDSDTITFTPGSDDIASIVFGGVGGLTGGLTWVRVSDTQITGSDGARLVVTLDLSVTNNVATVTATLNDNFDDHTGINVDDLADLGTVNVVATDIDGDPVSASVSVSVSDDLPSISASDPAADALTVDETFLAVDATADFSGLFTSSFNADNPGTPISYTLGINAGATGIVDVATGEAVVLVLNGAVVEGRTASSGDLVFTVSVDAGTGEVTLNQLRAVDHADANDANDPVSFAAADLITLTATIIDSDGDNAAATADIAGAMTFLDDGPDAVVVNAVADMLVLDESALPADGDGIRTVSASLADNFAAVIDYGADGAGSVDYALLLSADGIGSGLFALGANGAQGAEILLSLSGNTVTGSVGGTDYFTITVDPVTGDITFTQLENIWHGDSANPDDFETLTLDGAGEFLRIEQTVTDRDGDSDSATIELGDGVFKIDDDGPNVEALPTSATLSVSDSDLGTDASFSYAGSFVFDGGTDGTESIAYDLVVTSGSASGIYDTETGNQVFLFLESGVVVGREGANSGAAAGGQIVFTVTVAGDGTVELDQLRAVHHQLSNLDGANATLLADGLIQLKATITDNDLDTDSATIDIGSDLLFADDTPTAAVTQTAFLDDDTQTGGNAGGPDDQSPDESSLTGTLVDPVQGFGNDGGTVAFATTGAPAGFQYVASGSDILIQQDQGSGFVTVITVTLDPATGAYTVTQNANILHADDGNNDENEQSFTLSATLTDGDGDIANTSLTITVDDDTPVAIAGTSSGTVDEDGLPGGIADGTGDVPGEATVATGSAGSLFAAGADAPLAFGFDTAGAQAYLTSLGLTSGGTPLAFVVSGNLITATAGNGGATVFTMSLAANGSWQFSLAGPLDHALGDNENDLSIEFGPLVQATDADGDTVTATGSLLITIDDDTPSAVNDTNALSEDTALVGGNVLTDGTDDRFGADGPGAPAVTAISGSGGAGTVGGTTTGSWGTLDLAADGSYSYNLDTSLVQGLDDGEFRTDTFTYTIIDSDGDTSTATLTITINGANDAPVANADTNWTIEDAAAPITGNVLENFSHPNAPSGTFADVADTDVDVEPLTVSTTGTFNGTYGVLTLNADGSYSYRLYTQAENPAAYAAVQALDEGDTPLTDNFNYTAFDGTDSANSTLTISIFGANDAPVVGTATVATSDEGLAGGIPDNVGNPADTTNLATASGNIAIADVDDTVFTVTLSIPTESLAVADGSVSGAAIAWSLSGDGKTLTGTINGGTQTAITVVIDDLGAFTVTQSLPIFHPVTGSEDVVSFTVDVNVNDGTTTTTRTDAIAVNIEDDSPVAVVADAASGTNVAGSVITADLDADNDVDNNFGGDGGKVIFTAATIAALEAQGLTSGFVALEYSISPDGTVLTAVKEGTADTVFTLTLDPLSAPDQYVLNLVQKVDSSSTIDFNGGDFNFVGGNLSWTGFVPLAENLGGTPVDNQSRDLLLTPEVNGANAGSVNTTATIGGISGGASVGSGETFRIDFVLDLRGDPADTVGGQDYAALANRDHVFDGHYDANGATALFKSTSGSQVRITAFDDADGNTVVGDGAIDTITGVTIAYRGVAFGSIITPTSTPTNYTVNGQTFTVTLNADGSVSIDGIRGDSGSSLLGTVVGVFTADGFNSVEYTYESGGTFQVGDFGASVITNDPVTFDVPISVTDNDGDIVSSGVLDITLNPEPAPAASTGSQGTQSFTTAALLVDDSSQLIVPDSSNGSRQGSGETTLFRFEDALRATVRTMEFSTVAALSGGLILTQAAASTVQPDATGEDFGWSDLAIAPIDLQTPTGYDWQASAIDTLPGLFVTATGSVDFAQQSDLSRFDNGPDAALQLPQFVQDQPDQIDYYMADTSPAPAVPVFPFAGSTGAELGQAMEALLLLNAADGGLQPDGAGIGEDRAAAVLADIAAQDMLEQLIGSFDHAEPGSAPATMPEPVFDGGLLNHQFDGSLSIAVSASLVADQIDDAAMAAAQA